MPVFRIEIVPNESAAAARDSDVAAGLREAGLAGVEFVRASRLFFLEGELTRAVAERAARELFADPVTESSEVFAAGNEIPEPSAGIALEINLRPGVMDPVAESALAELRAEGIEVDAVRTARRYVVGGSIDAGELVKTAGRVLANDCIEQVALGTAGVHPSPKPPVFAFELRRVALRELELETLAQTWSEHCVHKTLKSAIVYRGAPLRLEADRGQADDSETVEIRYENLLKDTIVRATQELMAERRGPECLSVFEDNAGIIAFDDDFGIAFKVETHNTPSAIEPYGGAATGIGGCIRDVIGCGLGARPIANTDVFCVAPPDWPLDRLPAGVLHPWRVLRGVVKGVADYGNRMGIPTVNGAIHFDPRYLGNPLVYCGCVGIIPRDKVRKAARPGDRIVLVGGRTGRDGIHGATFSSAELTDTHADEFSHAVQIGNAITEKRCQDAILRARDDDAGCLYSAITDYLGFVRAADEYKVMGLASYGEAEFLDDFRAIVRPGADGDFSIDLSWMNYHVAPGSRVGYFSKKFLHRFGPARGKDEEITERHRNVAASAQAILEEVVLAMAVRLHEDTGSKNLCLAGGVALNCSMNGRLLREGPFESIYVQPAAGDDGIAIGGAYDLYHRLTGKPRSFVMKDARFGPEFGDETIRKCLDESGTAYETPDHLERRTAELLAEGKIVGWFQGRMEFGPRALGSRSILADPTRAEMKDLLNSRVKHREDFRPFAPSCLEERAPEYFPGCTSSPFMLFVYPVAESKRASVPAITHIDGTARVQTVSREGNPRYYALIEEFEKLRGVPMVLNTSFNVMGEPIVNTPDEALACFQSTGIDALVMGGYVVLKEVQRNS